MKQIYKSGVLLLACILVLAGCASKPNFFLHQSLDSQPFDHDDNRILLWSVDVDVFELTAGGVREEVPEWGKQANRNVREVLARHFAFLDEAETSPGFLADLPLTEFELEQIEEHLALFRVAMYSAYWTSIPANQSWHFKQDSFDYSLGKGLAFLKTKYGFDSGLVIFGQDYVSTSGRKAAAFTGALLGVAIPLGHSSLYAGLVDFESGNVLWLNREVSAGGSDLREIGSCGEMVDRLIVNFPGSYVVPQAE